MKSIFILLVLLLTISMAVEAKHKFSLHRHHYSRHYRKLNKFRLNANYK